MKKVLLITDYYPYGVMEEAFLETEIKYWALHKDIELIIIPMGLDKECREIPENIKVDLSFANYLRDNERKISANLYKVTCGLKSMISGFFWKEVLKQNVFTSSRIKELLLSMRKFFVYKDFFEKIYPQQDGAVFYTYWHTEVTYALQAHQNRSDYKLVTRTHRFDLYEEVTFQKYMPLRREFTKDLDYIFTITDSAIDYIVETYGFDRSKIMTSRLGVVDKKIVSQPSEEEKFHIVTCSALRPVKRLDLVIDLLESLSTHYPKITFDWSHMGDGPLSEEINGYAKKKLAKCDNVEYRLLGTVSNENVYQFYETNPVDVLINTSESEGVPVSIMEAMSCHIPIVATDVGGISDMIDNGYNGKIVSEKPTAVELYSTFSDLSFFKNDSTRKNAYLIYKNKYTASDNYEQFISLLTDIKSVN